MRWLHDASMTERAAPGAVRGKALMGRGVVSGHGTAGRGAEGAAPEVPHSTADQGALGRAAPPEPPIFVPAPEGFRRPAS